MKPSKSKTDVSRTASQRIATGVSEKPSRQTSSTSLTAVSRASLRQQQQPRLVWFYFYLLIHLILIAEFEYYSCRL